MKRARSPRGACNACVEANKIAENDLAVTHPIRLAMALNSSIFQADVFENTDEACEMTRVAFDDAITAPVIDIPAVTQQTLIAQTVQKTMEISQLQCIDKVSDGPVVLVEHVPQSHVAEKTVEIPQLDVVKKTIESPEIQTGHGTQDRIQQSSMEQVIEIPAASLAEKIVEMHITQNTQQVANTHVQHVVNAVEVEKHVVQEKINQETKRIEIPPLQFMEKAIDIPVVAQRQVPRIQVVEKTVEGPQLQIVEQTVETPETQTTQGAMKPDDPDAKIKFFTEEALHGVGGLIFDAHGNRVANELGRRNCVTGEMWKNEPPFNLALNKATSDDIAWQRKHYTGRGVRKLHESGTASVEDIEAPVSKMPDSIEAHCQTSLKTARNPNGEPYTAFTSDKSWDEASGKTVAHRQVPLIQRVQKMVEVPQVQFIDKVVDIPVIRQRHVSLGSSGGCAEGQGEEEQEEREMGRSLSQGGDCEHEEDETDAQVPGSELVQVAPNMGAGGSHPQATMGPGMGQRAARDPSDDRVSGETGKKTRRQDGCGSQKAGEAGKRELPA